MAIEIVKEKYTSPINTIDIGFGGGPVAHQRLVGPVVGVGVILPRAIRRCCPGRPGKVGGQVFQLIGVVNIVGGQTWSRVFPGEVVAPFTKPCAVGSHLA